MADTDQYKNCITYGQLSLIVRIRRLWMQLAMWRRAVIVSTAADFADLPLVKERLYYSPTMFKELFETFFGEEQSEHFRNYLVGQIIITNEILDASKAGDKDRVDAAAVRLYENADNFAKFLAQVNPYWDETQWKNLLYEYYKTIVLEIVTILSGRYDEAIEVYEGLEDQSQKIADYMAAGFIDYFVNNNQTPAGGQ